MQNLLVRFGETINLGVLDDGQVVYIDVLQSPSAFRIAAVPGERNPVHCTSLGKAMLAFLPEVKSKRSSERQSHDQEDSSAPLRTRNIFLSIGSVRERAVAVDMEENLTGVSASLLQYSISGVG